jgi:hypothetical protein
MVLRVRGEGPTEAMRKLPAQAIPEFSALQDLDPDHRGTVIGR